MNCTFRDEIIGEHNRSEGLRKGIWLTILYFLVELAIGVFANSLSMIGDSFHMLIDALVQILTYHSRNLRNISPRNSFVGYLSFGFRRVETIVTLFNIILLVCVKLLMLYGVYLRFHYGHHEVGTLLVFLAATVGLVINFKVSKLWHVHEHDNGEDGVKSASLHIRDDLYGSMAVMVSMAAIFIASLFGYRIYWFDSLAALFIFGLLWKTTYRITKSAAGVLMEAAPIGIDFGKVVASMNRVYGVEDVLDLHINKISSGFVVLTAQVHVRNHPCHDLVQNSIKTQLKEEFPDLRNAHFTIETRCHVDPV